MILLPNIPITDFINELVIILLRASTPTLFFTNKCEIKNTLGQSRRNETFKVYEALPFIVASNVVSSLLVRAQQRLPVERGIAQVTPK